MMHKKDTTWIQNAGLYGTWTFTTETMTDAGYYKGRAYVVMHIMPNPMQVKSCKIPPNPKTNETCLEANNMACSHQGAVDNEKEVCVSTETNEIEWSDATVFFFFGFELRTGIVRKDLYSVQTSDWLGPYNIILAPIEKHHKPNHTVADESTTANSPQTQLYVSRYVKTPWTESQLQRPFASSGIFNFKPDILESVVGTKAINATIHRQKNWRFGPHRDGLITSEEEASSPPKFLRENGREATENDGHGFLDAEGAPPPPSDDPYARHLKTCKNGDLVPVLPRIEIEKTTTPKGAGKPPDVKHAMRFDYSILSLPEKDNDKLYKLWPTMKQHLGPTFPLQGPYCYGKDPKRAYALRLSYDNTHGDKSLWKGVKGCVPYWPCWRDPPLPPAEQRIPENNGDFVGTYVLDPKGKEFIIIYTIGLFLVISMILNCKLANKLKKSQTGGSEGGYRELLPERSRGMPVDHGLRMRQQASRPAARAAPARAAAATTPRRNPRTNASYSEYLREAVEGRGSNGLEEPLLTKSSSEDNNTASRQEPPQGVEESKQEAE